MSHIKFDDLSIAVSYGSLNSAVHGRFCVKWKSDALSEVLFSRIASSRALFFVFTVAALSFATVACSSGLSADFEMSSTSGDVPHEVHFAPNDESDDISYLWEFGDGNTSTESAPTHTYQDAGTLTVRLTTSRGDSQSVTEQQISLRPGEAGWVTVEPATLTLESGERQSLTPSAFDSLGNPIPNVSFTWSASPEAGEILDDGTFIAGPEVGNFSDAVTVQYEHLGKTVSTLVPVEVVFGELDSIVIEPSSVNLRVNNRLDFRVIARDRQGHVLPDPDIDWDPLRVGIDEVLAGGEFRAGEVPTIGEEELVHVRVSVDRSTLTTTISGNISAGVLDRVDVTASVPQVAVGSSVELSASGFDRFGNPLELDSVEWLLVSEEFGQITENGVFTPSGAAVSANGPVVTAIGEFERVQSFTDVRLDILPGIATSIVLNPLSDSIPVGAANPFSALVIDDFGNVISGLQVEWSASSGGTMTETGVFIAGFETGEFTDAITARLPAGTSGNTTDLVAMADIVVRDRSSNFLAVEVSNFTDSGIILIDLISGAIRPLSEELDDNEGVEISPSWSPDGKRVAYSSDISGTMQVYDVDIETGDVRQLVDDPTGSGMPSISPDGSKLAFVITAGNNWQVYVADMPVPDSEGKITPIIREQATKISTDDSVQNLLPIWSPDGTKIAFTTSRSARDVDVKVAPADGSSEPVQLGEIGLSAFTWSHDGEHILVVHNQSGGGDSLLVLDAETGETAGFVPIPFQAFLTAWSPDSSEVAVIDRITGALWLLDSDGSSIRQALDRNFIPRRVAWSPVPVDAEAVLAEQSEEEEDEPELQ